MIMKKITFLSVALAIALATGNFVAVAEINPLAGKVIALDAGHATIDRVGSEPSLAAASHDPID